MSDTSVNTGNELLSRIIINNNNTYGANGEITEYIFQRDNINPQDKSSINVGLALVDQIDNSTFLAMDNYWYLIYGAPQADMGDPILWQGTADNPFLQMNEYFQGYRMLKNDNIVLRFELKTL